MVFDNLNEIHFEKNKPLMDYTKLIFFTFTYTFIEFVNGNYQYTIIKITFSIHGFLIFSPVIGYSPTFIQKSPKPQASSSG